MSIKEDYFVRRYIPLYFHTEGISRKLEIAKCEKCMINTSIVNLCPIHLEEVFNLRICDSKIKNGGLGLFAYKPIGGENPIFRKGKKLSNIFYTGKILTISELDNVNGKNNRRIYTQQLNRNEFVDSSIKRCVLSFINHSKTTNATFVRYRKTISLQFKKDIFHGEEIYCCYQKGYFNKTISNVSFNTNTNSYIM